jgi:hypothetical protein
MRQEADQSKDDGNAGGEGRLKEKEEGRTRGMA